MPKALFHRSVNLDLLHPVFLERLLALLADAESQGVVYKVYSGHRSFEEQLKLYKLYVGGGSRAAPPGLSAHNYGLAVDLGRWLNGVMSWADADLEPLRALCVKHKLVWGGIFADKPHLQLPGYVTGQQLLPLKRIYDSTNDLKAVWASVRTDL